jgi:ABC-type nickel/cobalt efflux system permease component RcnA
MKNKTKTTQPAISSSKHDFLILLSPSMENCKHKTKQTNTLFQATHDQHAYEQSLLHHQPPVWGRKWLTFFTLGLFLSHTILLLLNNYLLSL